MNDTQPHERRIVVGFDGSSSGKQALRWAVDRAGLAVAQDAELLVVGSHGRSGFARALPGSISAHCAQHAPCPVVIMRESGPP